MHEFQILVGKLQTSAMKAAECAYRQEKSFQILVGKLQTRG